MTYSTEPARRTACPDLDGDRQVGSGDIQAVACWNAYPDPHADAHAHTLSGSIVVDTTTGKEL